MSTPRTVHMVVPDGIDDPARPSGGNVYDQRLCAGLRAEGWWVQLHSVPGDWPHADETARRSLHTLLSNLPADALVLSDGLVASTVPEVLVPVSRRLRLVVLLHAPIGDRRGDERERLVLASAALVITTSSWARDWVLEVYGLDRDRVHEARPGVDKVAVSAGGQGGNELLCVASVTHEKGHDLLLEALARNVDLDWRCLCVGALTRTPVFVAELRRHLAMSGLGDRMVIAGPRTGGNLEAMYAAADAVVLASRAESYGMVVTEALARGLPVLASDVGGVPEALGSASDGTVPGILVPAGDVGAWAQTVRRWLCDAGLRGRLRAAALSRRTTLMGWSETTNKVSRLLCDVSR